MDGDDSFDDFFAAIFAVLVALFAGIGLAILLGWVR